MTVGLEQMTDLCNYSKAETNARQQVSTAKGEANGDGSVTLATVGATGSFTALGGEVVTVVDGIITGIV